MIYIWEIAKLQLLFISRQHESQQKVNLHKYTYVQIDMQTPAGNWFKIFI